MAVSIKLGIVSVMFAFASLVGGPVGFSAFALSFVLGCLAAYRGSKWWLTVPFSTGVAFAVLLYIGFHAA